MMKSVAEDRAETRTAELQVTRLANERSRLTISPKAQSYLALCATEFCLHILHESPLPQLARESWLHRFLCMDGSALTANVTKKRSRSVVRPRPHSLPSIFTSICIEPHGRMSEIDCLARSCENHQVNLSCSIKAVFPCVSFMKLLEVNFLVF